ncbi:MAG: histidine phosphatase family protein [Acidisphaera sp.]|nr:histidine phosphatase family protein [Acidisphaera sp.]MBV9813097.1 histidine phosphatase family protein [Acetobacteraceae bacterium]
MTLTLHLIRHGHYDMLDRALSGRAAGHSLSPQGRAQAEALAGVLGQAPLVSILSSPLERARETAAPLARLRGIPVRVKPAFNEIDVGSWTGMTFEALASEPEWRRWNTLRSMGCPPGGETMQAVQARAVAAVQTFGDGEGDIAVVTHADVIKALLTYFLGMPLDLHGRLEVAPASRSVVRLFENAVRVEAINLPPTP